MTKKVTERSKILKIINDIEKYESLGSYTSFSVYDVAYLYHLYYGGLRPNSRYFGDYLNSLKGAQSEGNFYNYVAFGLRLRKDAYKTEIISLYCENAKHIQHFHYYFRQFIKEGLIELSGYTYNGKRKLYKKVEGLSTTLAIRANREKGRKLNRKTRTAPRDVYVANEEGTPIVYTDDNGAVIPDRVPNHTHFYVFERLESGENKKLGRGYFSANYYSRPVSAYGTSIKGKNGSRSYKTVTGLLKAAKYRKIWA
jgi:hypothetical protein